MNEEVPEPRDPWRKAAPKRPWKCRNCASRFATSTALARHRHADHPAPPVRLPPPIGIGCVIDGLRFLTVAELDRHRRVRHPRYALGALPEP